MSISIPYDDLRLFAYSNDKLIEGKINGIVISFIGLGNQEMFGHEPAVVVADIVHQIEKAAHVDGFPL